MTFFLANWKYVLIATLFAASAALFYLWRDEVASYSDYRATVAAEGRAALAAAKAQEEKQDRITKETADALAIAIPILRQNAVDNYRRTHPAGVQSSACSGGLPSFTNSPESPDATNGAGVPACAPDAEFIERCAVSVGMVQGWQTWALRQGLPVE